MRKIIKIILQPQTWQSSIVFKDTSHWFVLFLVIYFIICLFLNAVWNFPHFHLFFFSFASVLLLAIFAEIRFSRQIKHIRGLTNINNGFLTANAKFTEFENSNWTGIIAFIVVGIFSIGGIAIYGNVTFDLTLILSLIFFSIVVYFSIVGYVQYILLFSYIVTLAYDKNNYKEIGKNIIENKLPEEINWLHSLTKLTHFYRSVFFSVGLFYIFAFWFYCSSPQFSVNLSHWVYYVLWVIIFLAIVVTFPIISILEFILIKKIVLKIKQSYINDIKKDLAEYTVKPEIERHILGEMFSISILQSSNYPISSRLSIIYAVIIGSLNLLGSIHTAVQLIEQFN